MTPEIETTFERAVSALAESGIEHCVIGALGRAAWGRPRATTDVDFAVACDGPGLARLGNLLAARGFRTVRELRPSGATEGPPELWIWSSPGGARVDLLVAHTPFEREALARRRRTYVGAVEVWAVSPEDLIVYKLIAGRPRDFDDIADVVATRAVAGDPIDWAHIERWAKAWDVEARLAGVHRG